MDIQFATSSVRARPLSLRIGSKLGHPVEATIEIGTPDPLDPASLVGTPAAIALVADHGSPALHHGVIASITALATSDPTAERRYTLELRSAIEWLSHRKTCRIFRKKTAVAIVREVLEGGGIQGPHFVNEVATEPPEREHITQWNETDAVFLRRICEEEGLYFRFDPKDGFDSFVLCDRSGNAPEELTAPLPFIDAANVRPTECVAYDAHHIRKRRPGKVTVRDYDPARPAVSLEGSKTGGVSAEQTTEVYRAPGRFRSESEGAREARIRLEALRAEAEVLEFQSTALSLRPGVAFEADSNLAVGPLPSGKYFVIETSFTFRVGDPLGSLHVKAIPLAVPYRLPRITPHPRIPGILSATVTGASGEEIHTDDGGHVRVRFDWDRSGPKDQTSSLPVRVMQNNLPGSMLIPRVGWEVLVGFEDGDPERPYVLGRSFNGKQLPPFSLPANKTITALGTVSSPGGAKPNMVHIDDGAGREHMMFNAGFGKTTDVGADMLNQTVGFDNTHITGSQTWTVGGNETISVENEWTVGVGSQTATVGGSQTLTIKATGSTSVGSETVLVGGALIENVGNPVTGLAEFAKAAAIAGVGQIPFVGPALSKAYSVGNSLYQGYKKGGKKGLAIAAGQTLTNEIAGHVPGADAIVAGIDNTGITPWSEKAQQRAAAQEAGGGGAGPGAGAAGAAAAAPGHRKFVVNGALTEVIGAVHGIQTPGSLKWTTLGPSTFAIGGSHSTAAIKVSRLTMAVSSDTAAATSITAATAIGRNAKAAHSLKAGGAMKLDAGGAVGVAASGSLSVQVGGAMSLEGGTVVFEVGGSSVSVHGGGVTLKSSLVTINGKTVHSGKESVG